MLVDPTTGKGARVVSSYEGVGSGGTWSSGHRFFAIEAIDGARRQRLLLLDGTLRHPIAALRYGQPLAWAPHGQLLAFRTLTSIRIFDASARRVIATIPVRAPYGFSADSLSWAPDERSVTVRAGPGLGHD